MSYLDVPRLHFFGTFTADPSTLNNDADNYGQLEPPFSPPPPGLDPGWNPNGSHAWTFEGCTVQTVVGPDGSSVQDPLVGTAVSSAATAPNSSPKLVDLDTEQQLVSMIFGLQIQVGDSTSGTVTGNFQPQPFNDLGQGAYYQSVLQDLTWSSDLASPVLQELQKLSPDALSIKFNVNLISNSPPPAQGSITGTIGPVIGDEPPNFLLGRLMRPQTPSNEPAVKGHAPPQLAAQSKQAPLNYTPFVVNGDRGKVVVDFGNTFPLSAFNPPQPVNPGPMQVAILPGQGSPQILGSVENTSAAYQATAAIQEFGVTAEQVSLLQSSILGVLLEGSPTLAEDEKATYLAVTPMVCRLNPGDSNPIDLVALSFGTPIANQTIDLLDASNRLGTIAPGIPVGTPREALLVTGKDGVARPLGQPTSVTTDANGRTSFTLTAAPQGPRNPRGNIDGQVYGVGFSWQLAGHSLDPHVFVSVHVYDLVSVPDSPDWENDVLPILGPYFDLYPYMNDPIGIDLADQQSVLANAGEITIRLLLPITDPRHMPVTRDLSNDKRQIVLNWLAQQKLGGQGGATP